MIGKYNYGTGRRKNAVARVFMKPGKGEIKVKSLEPVKEDIARMKKALAKANVTEGFMNSVSPGLMTARTFAHVCDVPVRLACNFCEYLRCPSASFSTRDTIPPLRSLHASYAVRCAPSHSWIASAQAR